MFVATPVTADGRSAPAWGKAHWVGVAQVDEAYVRGATQDALIPAFTMPYPPSSTSTVKLVVPATTARWAVPSTTTTTR